jgi:S-DNA-T family DNA segregation ATPase FtsK/SpoIIIE
MTKRQSTRRSSSGSRSRSSSTTRNRSSSSGSRSSGRSRSNSGSRSSGSRGRPSSSSRGRSGSSRSTASRRPTRKKKPPRIRLTVDQQLDIVGYALLVVAALTLLSFLSSSHGLIPTWWLGILRQTFGWGAYVTPAFLGLAGLYLVLRDFGDRLPRPTLAQIAGVLLTYFAVLTTMHLVAASYRDPFDTQAVAAAGDGGGRIGAAVVELLQRGLGYVGAILALVTVWIVAFMLLFGSHIKDLVLLIERLWERVKPSLDRAWQRMSDGLKGLGRKGQRPAGRGSVTGKARPGAVPQVTINARAGAGAAISKRPPEPPAPPSPVHIIGGGQVWRVPSLEEILDPGEDQDFSADILRTQAHTIEETLENLGLPVRVIEINRGPVVTQFGVEPLSTTGAGGREMRVKVSRISAAHNDLALALEARTLRIEAPIPGKSLVGIEVPNPEVALVALRDVMESEAFLTMDSPLRLALGHDVSGQSVVADLTAMPHLLIAGTTGSGKSVCLNSIIAALLLERSPVEIKLLLIDPKRVELTGYAGIPHLLSKVVVDMERVASTLQWLLREMDGRYRRFSEAGATNIRDFNEHVAAESGVKPLPYIVVIVDELADMMMMSPQETERAICRIAQMARATGIHLIVATQRPSVDVVTGLIKANFPARIAFNVASAVDSRVILDLPGAEQLLGSGDMLFLRGDSPNPVRLQGAWVSEDELRRLVDTWKQQGRPEAISADKPVQQQPLWEDMVEAHPVKELGDELLPEVINIVLTEQKASISLLQRKLRIGYTRAARIMDILAQEGVVGPQPTGGKQREVFPSAARKLLEGGE